MQRTERLIHDLRGRLDSMEAVARFQYFVQFKELARAEKLRQSAMDFVAGKITQKRFSKIASGMTTFHHPSKTKMPPALRKILNKK